MNRTRDPVFVLVDPSIGRTGAFVCAQNMAIALTGQIPTFLVVPTSAKFNPDDISPFVGIHQLPLRAQSRFLPASVCWLLGLLPSGLRLRFLLFETRATHLVLNDFYLLQGFICRLLGYRGQIITWVRVEPQRTGGRLTGLLWFLILISSNRVVSVSRFVKNKQPRWIKSDVVYDCLSRLPNERSSPPSNGRFVYLGNFMPGKGQDWAIEAFASLSSDFPQACLEFHGGTFDVPVNEDWKQALQRRCMLMGLQNRISFHEAYSDPFPILSRAFAALNFSRSETFSFTVLEALGAGVPVIATNSGGPSEIIVDRVTGLLVPVGDLEAMSQAMREFLLHPQITASMGREAARSVAKKFSMNSYQSDLRRLFFT